MNIYSGQIQGPFEKGLNILKEINIPYFFKIGIYSKPNHQIKINDILFQLGKTGILEIRDTNIYTISFLQNENSDCYIDYMAEKESE